jgi:hypothetical protein
MYKELIKMKTNLLLLIILSLFLFKPFTMPAQNWQWAVRMGGPFSSSHNPDEVVTAMATDAVGNIYVCGRIIEGADFNGLIPDTMIGKEDIFLAKFDCEGNPIWVQVAGNPDDGDIARSLVLDNSGHIYVTGFLLGDYLSRPITFIDPR